MHLLRTQPGGFVPDDSIADLGQTPAELVILCSGDSNLTLLAAAAGELAGDYPTCAWPTPPSCATTPRSTSTSRTCCATRG